MADHEIKEAVADVASSKNVATKADIAELSGKVVAMQWLLGLLFLMQVAIFVKLFF